MCLIHYGNIIVCKLLISNLLIHLAIALLVCYACSAESNFEESIFRKSRFDAYEFDDDDDYETGKSQPETVKPNGGDLVALWSMKYVAKHSANHHDLNQLQPEMISFTQSTGTKERGVAQPGAECGVSLGSVTSYNYDNSFTTNEKIQADNNVRSDSRTSHRFRHNGFSKRVYEGILAKQGDLPWMARIKIYKEPGEHPSHTCSGTIVNEWLIQTAAHCVSHCQDNKTRGAWVGLGMIEALVGRSNISWWSLNIAKSDVTFNAMILPKSNDGPDPPDPCQIQVESDLVLLVTSRRMDLFRSDQPTTKNSRLGRICVSGDDVTRDNLINRHGTISGWGETDSNGNQSNELRWGKLAIRKCADECAIPKVSKKVLCARGEYSGCMGDSGGPLMIRAANGRLTQVGVFSSYKSADRKCGPMSDMFFSKMTPAWAQFIETFDIEKFKERGIYAH